MKLLVKVRFANVINIINDKEVLPELLQNECNAREIYNSVQYFLRNPESIKTQLDIVKKTLNNIRSETILKKCNILCKGYVVSEL